VTQGNVHEYFPKGVKSILISTSRYKTLIYLICMSRSSQRTAREWDALMQHTLTGLGKARVPIRLLGISDSPISLTSSAALSWHQWLSRLRLVILVEIACGPSRIRNRHCWWREMYLPSLPWKVFQTSFGVVQPESRFEAEQSALCNGEADS